jgi:hypothetical protein
MKTAAKKISLVFLAAYFLLISALPASANCIWALNENCADIGASNNWTQKDDNNCIQGLKDSYNGSTRKCCCAADVEGCCIIKDNNGNETAQNTSSGEECQKKELDSKIKGYKNVRFYQDYTAVDNACISKNTLNCSWKEKKYKGASGKQDPTISGGCSGQEKESNDSACSSKKPEDSDSLGTTIKYVCCCGSASSQINPGSGAAPLFAFPELSVKIPELNLTPTSSLIKSIDTDGNVSISIPWIGEYIQAVYKYLFSIIGIVAALTIMAAGFLWMLSAGDNSKITRARQLISGSLLGIVLLFCSYMILYWINPELINLPSIKIGVVEKIDLFSLPIEDQINAPDSKGGSHGVPWYFQCSPEGKKTLFNYDGNNNKICEASPEEIEKYGKNNAPNICTSGCGVISSLMVLGKFNIKLSISQWTKEIVDNKGRKCGNGSNVAGLQTSLAKHGLKSVTINKNQISQALDDGHPIIISLHGPCGFTEKAHYVVLTGWRDKNKRLADVNDPGNSGQKAERKCINIDTLKDCGSSKPACSLNSAFYVYKP